MSVICLIYLSLFLAYSKLCHFDFKKSDILCCCYYPVLFVLERHFICKIIIITGSYSELDPPEHLFRLKLVCILLDTCGQYFNSGSSKKKLDCFLVFYQVSSMNLS